MEKRCNLPLPTSVLSLTPAGVGRAHPRQALSQAQGSHQTALPNQQTGPLRGAGSVTNLTRAGAWAEVWAGEEELELPFSQHQPPPRWPQSSRPPMSLKCDPGGPYLRDADTVGLIMKRGRVVIHVPDLDVHLPRDHLARQEWGASIGISLQPLSTQGLRNPASQGSRGLRGHSPPGGR